MNDDFVQAAAASGYSVLGPPLVGGSSHVFPAVDASRGAKVALKALSPGVDVARLEREASILREIDHPGIARYRDLLEIDGVKTLVLDWVEGQTLANLSRSQGPLRLSRALHLMTQVGEALDEVHDLGIVHRDLTPANILVEPAVNGGRPRARIVDFGVSRATGEDAVTVDGNVAGTARYLAPETIAGAAPTPQTDQYAAAIIIQELLTGRWPYPEADALAASMHHHLHSAPTPVREVNPSLPDHVEESLLRALAKDPADRFVSMESFLDHLYGRVVERQRKHFRWGARQQLLAAAAVLLGIALGGALAWNMRDEPPAEVTPELSDEDVAREAQEPDPSATVAPADPSTDDAVVPETTTSTTDLANRVEVIAWEAGLAESLVCNLVTEADFESPELPRNFYADPENPDRDRVVTGEGLDGSGALEIGDPGTFGIYGEIIDTDPSTAYIVSLNSRIDGEVFDSQLWVDWLDAEFNVIGQSEALDVLARPAGQHALVTGAAPSDAEYGVPRIFKDNGEGVLFVDELVFARADSDCADLLLG